VGVRYSRGLKLLSKESQVGEILLRIISHRGNLSGPGQRENHPEQIDLCIESGFDCEVDLWVQNGDLLLGHDFGEYKISFTWLKDRERSLWVHCKNSDALIYLNESKDHKLNFFWHESDQFTLTSSKKVWVYPGRQLISGCVAVLPEIWLNEEKESGLTRCFAICTDYPEKYKRDFNPSN
jgi:hypothetical protein